MATTYKKSKSGYYKVELSASHEVGGFIYKPGADHTVSEAILEGMIEAGKVETVVGAD